MQFHETSRTAWNAIMVSLHVHILVFIACNSENKKLLIIIIMIIIIIIIMNIAYNKCTYLLSNHLPKLKYLLLFKSV